MQRHRRHVRNQVLGPRALAVISCALALLAVQPMMGAGAAGAGKGRESAAVSTAAEFRVQSSEIKVVGKRGENKPKREIGERKSQSRELHILATVEMLQRWLRAELRAPERPVMQALVFQPACFGIELLMLPPCRQVAAGSWDGAGSLSERRFLIEHCLLAPPAA